MSVRERKDSRETETDRDRQSSSSGIPADQPLFDARQQNRDPPVPPLCAKGRVLWAKPTAPRMR